MAEFKIIEVSSFPEFRPSEQELSSYFSATQKYNSSQLTDFSRFCDVHVHLRSRDFLIKKRCVLELRRLPVGDIRGMLHA